MLFIIPLLIAIGNTLALPAALPPRPESNTKTLLMRGGHVSDETGKGYLQNKKCPKVESLDLPLDFHMKFPETAGQLGKDVEFLGSGEAGCGYAILYEGEIMAVAKTSRNGGAMKDREVEGLERVGEYYGKVEQYGREFVLMKYVPGVPIYQTQGWHDNVSPSGEGKRDKGMDVKDCVQFIQEHVFETIKSTAYNYAKKFEIWHDDLFFANVLFPQEYTHHDHTLEYHANHKLINQAQLIDWDLWFLESNAAVAWEDAVDGPTSHDTYYDKRGYPVRCRVPDSFDAIPPKGKQSRNYPYED